MRVDRVSNGRTAIEKLGVDIYPITPCRIFDAPVYRCTRNRYMEPRFTGELERTGLRWENRVTRARPSAGRRVYKIERSCRKSSTRPRVRPVSENSRTIVARLATTMHPFTVTILGLACCYLLPCIMAADETFASEEYASANVQQPVAPVEQPDNSGATLNRQKRTLFLKKKLIGAGLLGFGLGLAKGYKAGYYSGPPVHHVYLSPPPQSVRYVEYVEKPIFVERIIERPSPFSKPIHTEYKDPSAYGSW